VTALPAVLPSLLLPLPLLRVLVGTSAPILEALPATASAVRGTNVLLPSLCVVELLLLACSIEPPSSWAVMAGSSAGTRTSVMYQMMLA
jgi:hypothetical protein